MQKINGAPGAAAGNAVNEVRKVMKRLVVGVLAHVDSGKTTLSEALLLYRSRAGNATKIAAVYA